jgi:hypothetical protein
VALGVEGAQFQGRPCEIRALDDAEHMVLRDYSWVTLKENRPMLTISNRR